MTINDNIEVIKLIDTYGKLLTDKQYEIITDYYFDNLSLAEIGDNLSITRQAVSDSINKTIKSLKHYEDLLGIIHKETLLIDKLSNLVENTTNDNLADELNQIIDDIRG
jgi:predicted DNA-binding protein YlxM (UPF0122 family)